MKIISEDLNSLRISKTFEIEVDKNTTIEIIKYLIEDNYDYDCDYEMDEENKKKYDKLDEETQEDLDEFINEIRLLN